MSNTTSAEAFMAAVADLGLHVVIYPLLSPIYDGVEVVVAEHADDADIRGRLQSMGVAHGGVTWRTDSMTETAFSFVPDEI